MSRPVIGISANIFPAEDRRFYKNKELIVGERSIVDCILDAGGLPLTLPVVDDSDVVKQTADMIDGLVLSGGADVDPTSWGDTIRWPGQPRRDQFETKLVEQMRDADRPILGICRGLQMLNVAMGGSLIQDIKTDRPECHSHRSQELYCQLKHPLKIQAHTWVSQLFNDVVEAEVNSVHHQAIDALGNGVQALAWSDDGLIEAIEVTSDRWTRAVQWHPEWDYKEPTRQLFREFILACNT